MTDLSRNLMALAAAGKGARCAAPTGDEAHALVDFGLAHGPDYGASSADD